MGKLKLVLHVCVLRLSSFALLSLVLILLRIINSTTEATTDYPNENQNNTSTASTTTTTSIINRCRCDAWWSLIKGVLIVAKVSIVKVVAIAIIVH